MIHPAPARAAAPCAHRRGYGRRRALGATCLRTRNQGAIMRCGHRQPAITHEVYNCCADDARACVGILDRPNSVGVGDMARAPTAATAAMIPANGFKALLTACERNTTAHIVIRQAGTGNSFPLVRAFMLWERTCSYLHIFRHSCILPKINRRSGVAPSTYSRTAYLPHGL